MHREEMLELGERVWFGKLNEKDKQIPAKDLIDAGLEFYKNGDEFKSAALGEQNWFISCTYNHIAEYIASIK
jgi:hypothetical protein